MQKKLVALGTFYKNDVPEGFGLQCMEPELAQQIATSFIPGSSHRS